MKFRVFIVLCFLILALQPSKSVYSKSDDGGCAFMIVIVAGMILLTTSSNVGTLKRGLNNERETNQRQEAEIQALKLRIEKLEKQIEATNPTFELGAEPHADPRDFENPFPEQGVPEPVEPSSFNHRPRIFSDENPFPDLRLEVIGLSARTIDPDLRLIDVIRPTPERDVDGFFAEGSIP